MPSVIVLDDLAAEGLALLDAADGFTYDVRTKLKGAELRAALAEYDGAVLRSGVTITAESLEGNRRLRAIVRAGVGTDNIDKDAATRLGVVVMNTPSGNTLSTAEHAIALLLGLSRNVAPAYQALVEGRWDRKLYMGAQLADKTVGIVGLGRIGAAVAARLKAFEMRVLGYDPFMSRERAAELGVELVDSVDQMLPRVDYLTVHTPLNNETRGLFSMKSLEIIKPGARLINCARGGIYEMDALVAGLKSGKLAGVALDVFEEEPCTESELFGMKGVLCTPHLGASTEEAQTQVAVEGVELLINYLTTGAIRHSVNVLPLDPKTLAGMRGYLDVAYRLGLLLTQMDDKSAKSVQLHYRGELAERDTKLLTAAFACGLIEDAFDEDVNIVNAEMLLRERGIELREDSQSGKGAFSSLISAELATAGGSYQAGGTLFGNNMPRLVQINGHRLEAYLDGTLLLFAHRDVPGIIGAIGTIFGRHGVNIGQMAVGRDAPGGTAVGVLNLDGIPPQEPIEEVLRHEAIESAHLVKLPAAGELPHWLRGGE